MAILFQYISVAFHLSIVTCTMSYGIGASGIALTLAKDMKGFLHSINVNVRNDGKREHILKRFIGFIQTHAANKGLSTFDVKAFEFFKNSFQNIQYFFSCVCFRAGRIFSDIYQPLFAVLFAWSLGTICGSMLMIQMEIVEYLN